MYTTPLGGGRVLLGARKGASGECAERQNSEIDGVIESDRGDGW